MTHILATLLSLTFDGFGRLAFVDTQHVAWTCTGAHGTYTAQSVDVVAMCGRDTLLFANFEVK